jgi:hypothetical protein
MWRAGQRERDKKDKRQKNTKFYLLEYNAV